MPHRSRWDIEHKFLLVVKILLTTFDLAILSVLPVFWWQASHLISTSANLPSSLPDPFLIKQPAHGGMSGRDPGKLTIEPAVLFSLYSLLISSFSVL